MPDRAVEPGTNLCQAPGVSNAMGMRGQWAARDVVERAEFVERTVTEMGALLRSGAPYPEVAELLQRAEGALQSMSAALWRQELVRLTRPRRRDAA